MNYSPLLITNACFYLVLHSHCYQKKLECSEPATNNLLIYVRRKVRKIRKEMAATCTDRFSSHEIGLVSASPCRGLHGGDPFLLHKHLVLNPKRRLPRPWLRGRPRAPKVDAQHLHVMLRKSELLTTALTSVHYVKEKPHFSFSRLCSERSACEWHLVGVASLV